MRNAAISRADYREVAKRLDPEAYDPAAIVKFAKDSGFKYIVMTAKHYDGFALFDSKASDFNSVSILPSKRDLLMEFSKACKAGGMPLGFSYAVDQDWYNPGGNTSGPAWDPSQTGPKNTYLEKTVLPQLRELMANYGPAFTLFTDAGKVVPTRLIPAFEATLDPQVVVARDFGGDNDYYYTNGVARGFTTIQTDWEKCTTLGDSWGYRKGKVSWQTSDSILRELITTVSNGGNYLLNVGLDGDGKFPGEARKRLEDVGKWLSLHGESIYGTSRSPFVNHPWQGGATVRNDGKEGSTLYLHLFGREKRDKISLETLVTEPQSAEVIGTGQKLRVSGIAGRWELDTSDLSPQQDITVVKVHLPSVPVLGLGPAAANDSGRITLPLSEGTYTDKRTILGRTPESPELQLTSFKDAKDSGSWEVYCPAPVTVQLQITPASPLPAQGKSLTIWLGDKKIGEARILPEEATATPLATLQSKSFRLPVGTSQIRICGGEDDKNSQSISTSEINLVPCN